MMNKIKIVSKNSEIMENWHFDSAQCPKIGKLEKLISFHYSIIPIMQVNKAAYKFNNIYKNIMLLFFFAGSSLIFQSCEKDITIDLPKAEDKIVVEGWIENGQAANVIISRNSSYFEPIDQTTINHMFNVDAVVKVKDIEAGTEEVLTKTLNPLTIPPVMYKGSTLKGILNHHYSLSIVVDNKELSATTSIPDTIQLDSTWFKIEPHKDTLGLLWIRFQDPPTLGNYYRIFTKRITKDKRFVPVWGSVYDDAFFNGELIEYSFYKGTDHYAPAPDENSDATYYFEIGDTIITRFSVIDKVHYDFWRTYENAIYSGGNPFATPATIFSNINGGLGVWGGYATVYDTCIAKATP